MSVLSETKIRLLETAALIAKEERRLAEHPEHSAAISASIRSLEKMRRQLDFEFGEAANRLGLDVCKYRVFSDDGTYPLRSVGHAILDFQTLITTVYDALKSGPKQRGRSSVESIQESSFELAYTIAGSLGFALTLPNDRLLLDEIPTRIDDAIAVVCEMAKARATDSVAEFARRYGNASVRAMRKWADRHVRSGLSADMRWERNRRVRAELLIQLEELRLLQQAIDDTSDEQIESVELVGILTKVDLPHKRFSFALESGEAIEGKFSDAIDDAHEASVPHRYRFRLTKTTRTRFAYDEDEETYFLDGLSRLS